MHQRDGKSTLYDLFIKKALRGTKIADKSDSFEKKWNWNHEFFRMHNLVSTW